MAFSVTDGSKAFTRSTVEGDTLTGTFWISYIEWLPSAENDDFEAQDDDDKVLAEDKADSVSRKIFPIMGLVTDLELTVMDGGSVIVRLSSTPQSNHFR